MQTFLPYPDFTKSLQCLDDRRLGKQRVEAKQILKALGEYPTELLRPDEKPNPDAWRDHPCTRMWTGSAPALQLYHDIAIITWCSRGFNNSMPTIITDYIHIANNLAQDLTELGCMPKWFGQPNFHAAHRSNLLRKDPGHYGQFGWTEPDNLEYIWPEPTQ